LNPFIVIVRLDRTIQKPLCRWWNSCCAKIKVPELPDCGAPDAVEKVGRESRARNDPIEKACYSNQRCAGDLVF